MEMRRNPPMAPDPLKVAQQGLHGGPHSHSVHLDTAQDQGELAFTMDRKYRDYNLQGFKLICYYLLSAGLGIVYGWFGPKEKDIWYPWLVQLLFVPPLLLHTGVLLYWHRGGYGPRRGNKCHRCCTRLPKRFVETFRSTSLGGDKHGSGGGDMSLRVFFWYWTLVPYIGLFNSFTAPMYVNFCTGNGTATSVALGEHTAPSCTAVLAESGKGVYSGGYDTMQASMSASIITFGVVGLAVTLTLSRPSKACVAMWRVLKRDYVARYQGIMNDSKRRNTVDPLAGRVSSESDASDNPGSPRPRLDTEFEGMDVFDRMFQEAERRARMQTRKSIGMQLFCAFIALPPGLIAFARMYDARTEGWNLWVLQGAVCFLCTWASILMIAQYLMFVCLKAYQTCLNLARIMFLCTKRHATKGLRIPHFPLDRPTAMWQWFELRQLIVEHKFQEYYASSGSAMAVLVLWSVWFIGYSIVRSIILDGPSLFTLSNSWLTTITIIITIFLLQLLWTISTIYTWQQKHLVPLDAARLQIRFSTTQDPSLDPLPGAPASQDRVVPTTMQRVKLIDGVSATIQDEEHCPTIMGMPVKPAYFYAIGGYAAAAVVAVVSKSLATDSVA